MSIREIIKRLSRPPVQPTTERHSTIEPPPTTHQIRPLSYGGYEVISSDTPNMIATKTFGGWHVDDLNNPEGEGWDLAADDPHSKKLDSLVSSSQKK